MDARTQTLLDAWSGRHEIERIDPDGALSEAEAYALQLEAIDHRVAGGDKVIGLKTGLTSAAKQRTMGVDQPILGHMLASSRLLQGQTVSCGQFIHPRAEPEIAFLMAKDLPGPTNVEQARAAVGGVFAAIEIIDSRFRDFKFGLGDVIADNTSAAGVVFGEPRDLSPAIDLRLTGMVYQLNRQTVATAAGAAILDDPWQALVWLANKAGELGRPLQAGQYVLAGALCDAVFVSPGDEVTVEFDHLGELSVSFV